MEKHWHHLIFLCLQSSLLLAQTIPPEALLDRTAERSSAAATQTAPLARSSQSLWIGMHVIVDDAIDWAPFDVKQTLEVEKGLRQAVNEWFLLNKSSKTLQVVRPLEQQSQASLQLFWTIGLKLKSETSDQRKKAWLVSFAPQYKLVVANSGAVLMEGALESHQILLDHAHQKQFINYSAKKLVDVFRATHQELLASVDQMTQEQRDQFFVEFIDFKNINQVFEVLDAWKAELPQIEKVELQYIDEGKAKAELMLVKARMLPVAQFQERLGAILKQRLKSETLAQRALSGAQGLSFTMQMP